MPRLKGKNDSVTIPRSTYIEHLRALYDYEPDTGNLINRNTGDALGYANANGIQVAMFLNEMHTISKLVWMHQYGYLPLGQVRQHDPDQGTRITNLYDTKGKQNGQRSARYDPRTGKNVPKSGVRGITWQTARQNWRVIVQEKYLGNYDELEEAKRAHADWLDHLAREADTHEARRRWSGLEPLKPETHSTEPTQDILNNEYTYEPQTGKLYRNNLAHAGKEYALSSGERLEVGNPSASGRLKTMFRGKMYQVHHLIWCMHYGQMPATPIYHANLNPQDNRIENLTDKKLASS